VAGGDVRVGRLGVLTKGPVAVVVPRARLPRLPRGDRAAAQPRPHDAAIRRAHRRRHRPALLRRPLHPGGWDAIASFLLQENLARYTEGVGAPDRGPFFYLPVVFTDLYFPWSLLLRRRWRSCRGRHSRGPRGRAGRCGARGAHGPRTPAPRALDRRDRRLLLAVERPAGPLRPAVRGRRRALAGGLLDGCSPASGEAARPRGNRHVSFVAVVFVLIGAAGAWLAGACRPARPRGCHPCRRAARGRGDCRRGRDRAAVADRGPRGARRQSHRGPLDPGGPGAARLRTLQAVPHLAKAIEQQRPPFGHRHVQGGGAESRLLPPTPRGRNVRRRGVAGVLAERPDSVCVMPAEEFKAVSAACPCRRASSPAPALRCPARRLPRAHAPPKLVLVTAVP